MISCCLQSSNIEIYTLRGISSVNKNKQQTHLTKEPTLDTAASSFNQIMYLVCKSNELRCKEHEEEETCLSKHAELPTACTAIIAKELLTSGMRGAGCGSERPFRREWKSCVRPFLDTSRGILHMKFSLLCMSVSLTE